ncbi:MAG: hypothetical protein U0487_01820 [Patescibacteria group bacterium]
MKQPTQADSTLSQEAQRDVHRAALDPLGKSPEDLVKHAQEFVADANQRITELKNEDLDDEIRVSDYDFDTEEGRLAFRTRMKQVSDRRLAAAKQRLIAAGLIREDGSMIYDFPLPESGEPVIVVHEGLEAHGLSLTQAEYDADWRIIIFDGRPMKRCNNEQLKRILLNQDS